MENYLNIILIIVNLVIILSVLILILILFKNIKLLKNMINDNNKFNKNIYCDLLEELYKVNETYKYINNYEIIEEILEKNKKDKVKDSKNKKYKLNSLYAKQLETIIINKRVLIMDRTSMAFFTRETLQNVGIESDIVSSKNQLIGNFYSSQNKYDFVLSGSILDDTTDITDVIETIKNSTDENIPIYLLTTDSSFEDEYENIGFDGYLEKPLKIAKLIELLKNDKM